MSCKDRITKFYWFSFGPWVNFQRYVMLWVATEDILAGSLQSTAIVMIAFTVPDIFSKAVVSPWILKRISFLPAFILYSFMLVAIMLIFVFVNIVNMRLAGMCVLGLSNGLGTIAAAKLLGFNRDYTALTQSGGNFATALASISYTGLTTWLCVSPRIALGILSPLFLLPLVLYALLDKEPLETQKSSIKSTTYQPLQNMDKNKQSHLAIGSGSEKVSIGRELKHLSKYFRVIYYMNACNFLNHLSLTAILSTVTFKSSPFLPRDHYQYYRLLNDFGIMMGGMELSLVSFFCPGFLDFIKIRRIWIVILCHISHVIVFVSVAWFHYIENVYIIFILCFTQGLVAGITFVHSPSLTAELFHDSRELGAVLGYLEVSSSVGRLSAALLGMFAEKYLREHCDYRLLLGKFCLARLSSPEMWTTSNCKK